MIRCRNNESERSAYAVMAEADHLKIERLIRQGERRMSRFLF